tara:strand:- start:2390 stop:2731 length:342 start_codon:yes stop_codon:yes gene_type:complete
MLRVGAIIFMGLLAVGCTVPKSTKIPLSVSASAMTEMRATHSILQKRQLASLNCRKSGYRKRTAAYYQCMRALLARDLQRTRERADSYFHQAAQKHGVCMERSTYRVARCLEI